MLERVSEDGRHVLTHATREAQRFNHEFLATEHLLLAILQLPECTAGVALERVGASFDQLHSHARGLLKPGPAGMGVGEMPVGKSVRRVIESAIRIANESDQQAADSFHLLLGLLEEHGDPVAQVLIKAGVTGSELRAQIFPKSQFDVHRQENDSTLESAMERARTYARHSNHAQPGTAHLVLGMLDEPQCDAMQVFEAASIDLSRLRAELLKVLSLQVDKNQ